MIRHAPSKNKSNRMRLISFCAGICLTVLLPLKAARPQDGVMLPVAQLVGRSDILLQRPNLTPAQAMLLGNGSLGVAVWAADGMTVQLNRSDTLPARLSPGQLVFPALTQMTLAPDYQGRLALYQGEFLQSGGGLRTRVYVEPQRDLLVIEVSGADPGHPLSADLHLWQPRKATASLTATQAILYGSWLDDAQPNASGRRFGALAGLAADARDVVFTSPDPLRVRITFRPRANGSFRLLLAAPHWDGQLAPAKVAAAHLSPQNPQDHRRWWQHYWQRTGLIRLHSADGSADYMENLRTLFLFYAAAGKGDVIPGTQAGIADMFSAVQDSHRWDPGSFWHWNLRMMVAASLLAGHPELNLPYFRLYRGNLSAMQAWTREHMAGRPGICVPETMRFNGAGLEYELWNGPQHPVLGLNCDAASKPYYNARTLSTGAEVAFWIWQQFLATGDRAFLAHNYPLMREAARFLLSYETGGPDGLRHTSPSNAHETQWDTTDPTTDLLARRSLYQHTLSAAKLLRLDQPLRKQLRAELLLIPPLPQTAPQNAATPNASADQTVVADSARPDLPRHNVENIGLEPVWPWGVIGDDSPLTPLARRTWAARPFPVDQDWSFDPIQAARLGLAEDVASTLRKLTERYQIYPNGLASWGGGTGEFYLEHAGVVATALSEALVQQQDGLIRLAPAIPSAWDVAGTVFVRGNGKVFVSVHNGQVQAATFSAGNTRQVRLRTPWPGEPVQLLDQVSGRLLPFPASQPVLTFQAIAGHHYRLTSPTPAIPFPAETMTPKRLANREIGLSR